MTRRLITISLTVFVALLLGALAGCTGTGANVQNVTIGQSNTAEPASTETSAQPAGSDASSFPPLASNIANADIELADGSMIKAGDKKGKVILLNLWGIWCGPCRAEMPHLIEMQDTFRDQGFEVLGLNIGDENTQPEPFENIEKFKREMKLNYTLGRITSSTSNEFNRLTNFPGVPQSVLVDRSGRMRGVFLGGGPNVINKMKETVAKVVNEAG